MEILFKSLASSVVVAALLLLSEHVGPKLAGAIGGIPIIFAISYVLVVQSNKGSSQDFLMGGVYGALAAIFFSLVLIGFNRYFPQHLWINFSVAYVLCFFFALGSVYLTSK